MRCAHQTRVVRSSRRLYHMPCLAFQRCRICRIAYLVLAVIEAPKHERLWASCGASASAACTQTSQTPSERCQTARHDSELVHCRLRQLIQLHRLRVI
jgi:hypothetical protein